MTHAVPSLWKRWLGGHNSPASAHMANRPVLPGSGPVFDASSSVGDEGAPAAFEPTGIEAGQKRVCFWGAPSHFQPEDDWRVNLARTGANTGNLFIGNGLFNNTNCAEKAYGLDFDRADPARLHEAYDIMFIPASNFLNPTSDFQKAFDFLSRTKLPLFCFGLGSQHLPGRSLQLKPGTEQFIRLLSERSQAVGVRGDFTADLMNGMGLKNVSVVGCPSLLGLSAAAVERIGRQAPSLEKVGVHFSNNVRSHAFDPDAMRHTENALFHRTMSENAFYIIQNEIEEFQLLEALAAGDDAAIGRSLNALAKTFEVALPNEAFTNFLRHRIRVFFEIPRWVGAVQTMSACIGSRFHGTVAALLAGTPSLLLAHDMRTQELAEFFDIPRLILNRKYSEHEMIEQLLAVDLKPFVSRLPTIRVIWRDFAWANGLDLAHTPVRL